jgi:hypothetical protein
MNNKLKELFESSVLNDETKEVLTTVFDEALKAKETEIRAEADAKLVEEKAAMLEEVNKIVEETISEELTSLKEELETARALEVTYATKLQEFKESYAEKQEELVKTLIAESVTEEVEELKEDIELAKKHEFVMQMYESFGEVYKKLFGGVEIDIHDELEKTKKELNEMKHEKKLNELLESVTGEKREIAKTILESVAYDKLDKKFESIKGILLAESKKEESKEQLEESDKDEEPKGKVVMENVESDDEKEISAVDERILQQLKKSLQFAGVRAK